MWASSLKLISSAYTQDIDEDAKGRTRYGHCGYVCCYVCLVPNSSLMAQYYRIRRSDSLTRCKHLLVTANRMPRYTYTYLLYPGFKVSVWQVAGQFSIGVLGRYIRSVLMRAAVIDHRGRYERETEALSKGREKVVVHTRD